MKCLAQSRYGCFVKEGDPNMDPLYYDPFIMGTPKRAPLILGVSHRKRIMASYRIYMSFSHTPPLSNRAYLEGQWDVVSRLIMERIRVTTWVIGVINLLSMCP